MLGLIIAMTQELEAFFEAFQSREAIVYKSKSFYITKYNGTDIVLAQSGVGKVNAAYTATLMIERFAPTFIINTGVAGGFGLDIFDVFIAQSVVQHDVDTTPFGDPRGYISGLGEVFIAADPDFVRLCQDNITNVKKGIIASGDQFIASPTAAQSIVSAFGALACDMESGAIGQVARMAGVGFGIIRTITDNGDDDAKISFEDKLHKAARINKDAVISVINKLV